ncbi:Predicted N-acetyltransferase YhbS [Frankineae bacterium MT45]|nr:Predicted N-acetyltransferase YhbS [Frankineae bacterium MT45]
MWPPGWTYQFAPPRWRRRVVIGTNHLGARSIRQSLVIRGEMMADPGLGPRWWGEQIRRRQGHLDVTETDVETIEPLRRAVLRDGRADLDARTPEDDRPSTLHLVATLLPDRQIAGCLTLIEQPFIDDSRRVNLRLVLMAVDPQVQHGGVGTLLVGAAQTVAAGAGCGIWANARDSALGFYARLGFVVSGDGFIGAMNLPHHRIYWIGSASSSDPEAGE